MNKIQGFFLRYYSELYTS